MSHILAVSPHLDDAAFSVGGMLAAHARGGGRVTIVTCFTATMPDPTDFALACQLDKGLGPEVDYMALRRTEDQAACAVIGARAIHLPLPEAPHRGYDDARALFTGRHAGDTILPALTEAIRQVLVDCAGDVVLGPLAIGDHVDHWLVRDALIATEAGALLWEDWPYVARADRKPAMQPVRRHVPDDRDRADKAAMCACYASQIGFQFGSPAGLSAALDAAESERLHRV